MLPWYYHRPLPLKTLALWNSEFVVEFVHPCIRWLDVSGEKKTTRRTTAMTRMKPRVPTPARRTTLSWLFPSFGVGVPSTVCSGKLSSNMKLVFFLCKLSCIIFSVGLRVTAKSIPRVMLNLFYDSLPIFIMISGRGRIVINWWILYYILVKHVAKHQKMIAG